MSFDEACRIGGLFGGVEEYWQRGRRGGHQAKPFHLERKADVSGVSGTGRVAEGVEFPNGQVIIKWLGGRPSLVLWQCMEHAKSVHGHNGGTEFVYE